MRRALLILLVAATAFAAPSQSVDSGANPAETRGGWEPLKAAIEQYLGRPYVWGACGLKSFDCSGFVWRVMADNGILIKRTTARKLYMSLPRVSGNQRFESGNIVFFDNLKHCGIVASDRHFYHAETSIGTNLSKFDPYWRPKITGIRAMPPVEASSPGPKRQ